MFINTRNIDEDVRPVAATLTLPEMEGVQAAGAEASVTGEVRRLEGGFHLTGQLSTRVGLPCSRCATHYLASAEIDINLVYKPLGSVPAAPQAEEEIELTPEDCTLADLDSEGRINLVELARDQIYLWIPLKAVCKTVCRGLCSQCGTDLNTQPCTCRIPGLDPRLAPLAELKKRI